MCSLGYAFSWGSSKIRVLMVMAVLLTPALAIAHEQSGESVLEMLDRATSARARTERPTPLRIERASSFLKALQLPPSVVDAAGRVLSGAGRAELFHLRDGGRFIRVDTSEGVVKAGRRESAQWIEVQDRSWRPDMEHSMLFGNAHIDSWSIAMRGRVWRLEQARRTSEPRPHAQNDQDELYNHLEHRVRQLLSEPASRLRQARHDFEWALATLSLARKSNNPLGVREQPSEITWQATVLDGKGHLRELAIQDRHLALPGKAQTLVSAVRVSGQETRTGALGVNQKEFRREPLSYIHRARVARRSQ